VLQPTRSHRPLKLLLATVVVSTGCATWSTAPSQSTSASGTPETESPALEPPPSDDAVPVTETTTLEYLAGDDAGEQLDPAPEPLHRDPEAIQREALELCQSAEEFLDQGEMDDAIAALDHAYGLMLELPNDGDEDWLQAREDLRLVIAELLIRTYDSQRATASGPSTSWDLEIPIVENDEVQREIRSFTGPEKDAFLAAYRRSGAYRPLILAKLEEAGLPSQLSWLPLVESQFKDRALSRAGALGLWQFIASTGLRYGLNRDGWVDERMDPSAATDAAIAYLIDLHGLFGDWPKALAAYNCGEARVLRLQRESPNAYLDFWDLYQRLPRETRRYVPRFFATLAILENPERYGMQLPTPDSPLPHWVTVPVDRSIQLSRLDVELGLEEGALARLNPELRHRATPPRTYDLKVPVGGEAMLLAKLDAIPEWSPPTPQYVTHRVRRGDTMSGIAARYGTSVSAIMRSNNLRSANRIYPGQRLQVPASGAVRSSRTAAPARVESPDGTHTVRRGESLYSIARRYSTTVARLKADNGLSSNTIFPGQNLKVAPGSRDDLRRYQVQRGDTLSEIADRNRVRLSSLLRANGLSSRSTIYPGQWLVIP
jgi:membrane-bound lytic murein transglycosylase D